MDQSDSDPVLASRDQQSEVLEIPSVKEKWFKCNICDKKFTLNGQLKLHISVVHDKIKPFECPHCPYKAAERSNVKKHIFTHTGEKKFPCPHCPYKAAQSGSLKYHILTHTGEKKFQCDICDKKFTRSGSLKLHISTVHDKIKPFSCPHCPYKAGRRGNLKAHLLTHDKLSMELN